MIAKIKMKIKMKMKTSVFCRRENEDKNKD